MVKELNQVYKCSVCGNIVETLHAGGGELVCCNKPMDLLEENSVDAATEKHVPVVEETATGVIVKVGSVSHPMEEAHHIEWITIITKDGKVGRKFLKPGDKPEAEFFMKKDNIVKAREYCNLHGLWRS
ncbi:desulfoferrodoxin [Thermoproteota archaeon]